MSLLEKPKFLTVIIIALLLLNFGTLTFMWMHQPARQHDERGGPDVYSFLVNGLKMNERQQEQYAALRDEHHAAVEELQRQSRNLHDNYFNLLHSPSPDSVMVMQLADSMAAIQKQIELVTFYHFQKVRAICNPEQQKKFDEIINEAMRMMAPRRPPPPR